MKQSEAVISDHFVGMLFIHGMNRNTQNMVFWHLEKMNNEDKGQQNKRI